MDARVCLYPVINGETDTSTIIEVLHEDEARFYWTPEPDPAERDIIAFLPGEPANPGYIMSYQHIGQHGEASLGYATQCTRAKKHEYQALKRELISLGYNLEK